MPNVEPRTLSQAEQIGQLFFIGIPGTVFDSATSQLVEEIKPGGVCLFARNIKEPEQTRELNEQVSKHLTVEPFLSVDQEGGLVDRLRRVLAPMPAAARIPDAGSAGTQAAIIASALSQLGFNMNFAPVVDVIDAERAKFQNGLHSRAYGETAREVASIAGNFLRMLQANGILGCIKHFPGLGGSQVDSHDELPLVPVGSQLLEELDLFPYRQLISTGDAKCVMVAHAAYPNVELQESDQDGKLLPSSLSFNFVTKLLRQKMRFDGLILTDDLEMGAIVKNYGIGEASVMAILAGNDMVSICANPDAIRESAGAVTSAIKSGRIPMEKLAASVARILRLKSSIRKPENFDLCRVASLTKEIAQLDQALS